MQKEQIFLRRLCGEILERISGRQVIAQSLCAADFNPSYVVATGKAGESLLRGVLDVYQPQKSLLISAPAYFTEESWPETVDVCSGSHPVPDEKSLAAGFALITFLENIPDGEDVLFLISGGSSAMVEVMRPGLQLTDLQRATNWMLSNGLSIGDMNAVRKRLSAIKNGGLLRYLRHLRVHARYISDVYPDDPSVIGSGLLCSADIALPEVLPGWLGNMLGKVEDIVEYELQSESVIMSPAMAREMVSTIAGDQVAVHLHDKYLGDELERVAQYLMDFLCDAEDGLHVWSAEPLVRLCEEPGRGGRMTHLALLLAQAEIPHCCIACLSTDGMDGRSAAGGAIVSSTSAGDGASIGLHASDFIENFDSASYLGMIRALIPGSVTGTNVTDLIIIFKNSGIQADMTIQ